MTGEPEIVARPVNPLVGLRLATCGGGHVGFGDLLPRVPMAAEISRELATLPFQLQPVRPELVVSMQSEDELQPRLH